MTDKEKYLPNKKRLAAKEVTKRTVYDYGPSKTPVSIPDRDAATDKEVQVRGHVRSAPPQKAKEGFFEGLRRKRAERREEREEDRRQIDEAEAFKRTLEPKE